MAIQLGSAYGKVEIDSSGVKRGVNDAVQSMGTLQSKAQALGKTLENVGKSMTLAISLPMALMAKDAVMAASAYEESLNKVKVVFEKNSDAIIDWSQTASKNLKMTKQEALEAAATFGNLFDTIGLTEEKNAEMSMSLVQLAADMASLHNISPEEALLKLRAGLVGEVEPLRTVGVLLSEARVKAKAMEMGLAGANGELSEAAKVQARYALILEQTVNAQGDLARTSGSFANQLRGLKANWGDFLKILGEQLLPIATKVLTKLNEFLEWFNNAPPQVQKIIIAIGLLLFVIGPLLFVVGKILPLAFATATKSLNPFSGGLFGLIATVVKWIGYAAIIVKVLSVFGVSTGIVGAKILALNAAIAGIGGSIISVLAPILLIIATLAFLYWAFKNNFMGITTTAQQLWFLLKFYFQQGWQMLLQVSQQRAVQLVNWFKTTAQRIVNFMKAVPWSSIGKYIIQGIVAGLTGNLAGLMLSVAKVSSAIKKSFDRDMDINSPSGWFKSRGLYSVQGYMQGLSAVNSAEVAKAISKPVTTQSVNTQNSNVMNFGNGLTVRDVDKLLEQKLNNFTKRASAALGGA